MKRPQVSLYNSSYLALDAESEHQVQKALDNLIKMGGQTVIVIAHRLSTIKDADEIVVLKRGEIAERGTHEGLLKRVDGVYRQLVERQLTGLTGPLIGEETKE